MYHAFCIVFLAGPGLGGFLMWGGVSEVGGMSPNGKSVWLLCMRDPVAGALEFD